MKSTTRLRQLLAHPGMLIAPGAHDVLTARLVEAEGFDAVYLGGFAASASMLGIPDHSLITMTELLAQARNVMAVRTWATPFVNRRSTPPPLTTPSVPHSALIVSTLLCRL